MSGSSTSTRTDDGDGGSGSESDFSSLEIASKPFPDADNLCPCLVLDALRFHDIWQDCAENPLMVMIESSSVVVIMTYNTMKEIDSILRQEELEDWE